MGQKRIIHGLDIFKWVCAFLIVYLHTYNRDWGIYGKWFLNVIASIGVPFFFIVSGFFFGKGISRSGFSKEYFLKYFSRILVMYIAWTIITLPVSWLCITRGHADFSLGLKIAYLLRMIFFSGSCGIYWYLLALLCCSSMIYFFMKRRWNIILYIIALICFGLGVWYNSPYNNHNLLFQGIHVVFGSERNFLNVGLLYMCIGYFFATHEIKMKPYPLILLFVCIVALRTYETNILHINSLQAVLAVVLFLVAFNTNIKIKDENSLTIRKLSTAMYLVHYPFILLFDFYLKRGTSIDYPVTICFCLISFWIITRCLSHKWQRVLIG